MESMKAQKPLGGKAYGSIPHLPNSRMGPGDYHCHEGQARICTEKSRDRHDRVIVTEKLDGSNVAIAMLDGRLVALTRAGYPATTSPYRQHHAFAAWVDRLSLVIPDRWRISGEWMHTAHGTLYTPDAPLICFDVFNDKNERLPHDAARCVMSDNGLIGAKVISDGPPVQVEEALSALGEFGFHGALEQVEGAVWRVERRGAFDFMTKYVRPDKIDGKYLESVTGGDPIIMWPA